MIFMLAIYPYYWSTTRLSEIELTFHMQKEGTRIWRPKVQQRTAKPKNLQALVDGKRER